MKLTTTLLAGQKSWRDAASLLLCCPVKINGGQKSIAFLVTKRSKDSKFMPGGYCFPGGTTSPADSSSEWWGLYKNAGIDLHKQVFMSASSHQPPIYTSDLAERIDANLLPPQISLRITALRETFEECGLLLSSTAVRSGDSSTGNPPQLQNKEELMRWQDKVKDNPEEFINLCQKLSVLPDLTALYEWSNWLTPPTYKSPKRRFDTVFYMACVPQQLSINLDKHESEAAEWSTAASLVKGHEEGEHELLPPQYYELTRLSKVHSTDDIVKLGNARKEIGFERWLPDVIVTTDGITSLLPGDELYPDLYDPAELKGPTIYKSTNEDFLKSTSKHHCWKFTATKKGMMGVFVNNTTARFGHFYSVADLPSSPDN